MPVSVPNVMVSSTFYDLRQIRADLGAFLEREMGYQPMLSEFPSFPVDPDVDTIENCRRRVNREADALVLLVGGRYGFTDPSTSKSVTNLEYLTARAKGLPIFAFVEKRVLTLLPVWELNHDAAFESWLDPAVFPFVHDLRSVSRVWTHEFETAQDVIGALRIQFAHLMRRGLALQARLQERLIPESLTLSARAFRIAVERPRAWEWRLFAQLLCEEIAAHNAVRRDQRWGVTLGPVESVPAASGVNWLNDRLQELTNVCTTLDTLMNRAFPDAIKPPGTPADLEALGFVASRVGSCYRAALDWNLRLQRVTIGPLLSPVVLELARFADDILLQLEEFGPNAVATIDRAAAVPPDAKEEFKVTLRLRIPDDVLARFNVALAAVRNAPMQ